MKRTVIIADDAAIDRSILKRILLSTYDVLEAKTGREALSLYETYFASLSAMIIDIHMPDMDGFVLIKSITSSPTWYHLPLIVVTEDRDIKQQEEALRLGAVGFIEKPYNKTILLHTISNAIDLHEMSSVYNSLRKDELTGLWNRKGFIEEATPLIEKAPKGHYVMTALNISNFKLINDQYGSLAGDRLLCLVASVIQESFSIGADGGLAGRIGSDKFIILTPTDYLLNNNREKYYKMIQNPSFLPQRVHFRLGRRSIDDPSLPVSKYISQAFMAEQSIRQDYGGFIAYYDSKMMDELLAHQQIASHMVESLQKNEFVPYFQPQFNHDSGTLIGGEALVRWIHGGKVIQPQEFIPLFEQNGFIYELDCYIWEEVCKYMRKWIDGGKSLVPISVNVSRNDLAHDGCVDFIASLLKKYSLPIEYFRIEITESVFSSEAFIQQKIARIIEEGFVVEIDDFGSGYSSLNILKNVKASIIKLDMRFFERCADESRAATVVQFAVRLAKWLGMDVIAEGVETADVADFLKSIGCFFIQGYLYSKPVPVEEFQKLLKKGPIIQPKRSNPAPIFVSSKINDPNSFDAWLFKTKAGPACILEINDKGVEVLRVNDAYIGALSKIGIPIQDVLKLNWRAYFDEATKQRFQICWKRLLNGENDVKEVLTFVDMPGAPKKFSVDACQTVLAKETYSTILYCAVTFLL